MLLQALSKNGKVYGNGIMVGVQPCIDKVSVTLKISSTWTHVLMCACFFFFFFLSVCKVMCSKVVRLTA